MTTDLVVCETVAAITTHARRVDEATPIRLSGHSSEVLSLCGAKVAWDTRLPIEAVRCLRCREALGGRTWL
jgi:hypothetical protein